MRVFDGIFTLGILSAVILGIDSMYINTITAEKSLQVKIPKSLRTEYQGTKYHRDKIPGSQNNKVTKYQTYSMTRETNSSA